MKELEKYTDEQLLTELLMRKMSMSQPRFSGGNPNPFKVRVEGVKSGVSIDEVERNLKAFREHMKGTSL